MIFNYDVSDLQSAIGDVQGQICAYVETENTASRAYSIGDLVIWKGTLYLVTAAISSGGTFTSGTNIASKTIGDLLTTTEAALTDCPTGADGTARKYGKVVTVNGGIGDVNTFTSTGNWTVMGTVPSGYRPLSALYFPMFYRIGTDNTIRWTYVRIKANGVVEGYGWGTDNVIKNGGFAATYLVKV